MDGSLSSVEALGTKWCILWSGDVDPWLAMHTPRASFLDHAMQIHRQGLPNIKDHFEIWKGALPDAKLTFEGAWPGEQLPGGKWRLMMRARWTGAFVNDLPTVKATGNRIDFPVRVEMIVRDEGLIEEAAEWYSTKFWKVGPVSKYNRRGELPWTA